MLDVVTWTVDPAIFTIFTREIRWYGLFFAIGFLLGYQIEDKIFKHDNAPAGWCDKIFIYVVIATVIGSRTLPFLRMGILLSPSIRYF